MISAKQVIGEDIKVQNCLKISGKIRKITMKMIRNDSK